MNESRLKSSIVLRMVIIAGLTLILLIPALFVEALVTERSSRRAAATQSVSESWGGAQTLVGPVLSVPFKESSRNENGVVVTIIRYAHFLPSALHIQGTLNPEIRYRGIYEVPLYEAEFLVWGPFFFPDVAALRVPPETALWDDAVITFGISDLKGIRDAINLRWNTSVVPDDQNSIKNEERTDSILTV